MESVEPLALIKLQGESNWPNWKFAVNLVLQEKDLVEIVTGEKKGAKDEKASDVECKKEFLAQRIIGLSMTQQTSTLLLSCTTAKQMWDKLHEVFEPRNEMATMALNEQFLAAVKEEGGGHDLLRVEDRGDGQKAGCNGVPGGTKDAPHENPEGASTLISPIYDLLGLHLPSSAKYCQSPGEAGDGGGTIGPWAERGRWCRTCSEAAAQATSAAKRNTARSRQFHPRC